MLTANVGIKMSHEEISPDAAFENWKNHILGSTHHFTNLQIKSKPLAPLPSL